MSIYATLWEIKLPRDRMDPDNPANWVEVYAQAVPAHIGHPKEGYNSDPYADFLPPVVQEYDPDNRDPDYDPPHRAVVILQEGRDRKEIQRYSDPLLVLSGEEYRRLSFQQLLDKIHEGLRDLEENK